MRLFGFHYMRFNVTMSDDYRLSVFLHDALA
jgi:hypothetical protein